MSAVEINEKLLLNAGGWQAMTPARQLFRGGRVADARYDAPMLTGIVREGSRNYRAGLRVKTAIDVENLCTCHESRAWGKICAHSVAVGLAYLSPSATEPEPAIAPPATELPIPTFVPEGSDGALGARLYLILPPNFAAAWIRGQVMLVAEAETSRGRTMLSALDARSTYACDAADLGAFEALREFAAIFASGMVTLSRDMFLRLLPSLQNHPRITFGKASRVTISSASLRPSLSVDSRRDGGIAVKANLPPDSLLLWNATEAWFLRNHEFVRCAEALPAGSTNLIERPLLLDGDRALRFLAFDLPRLREAFEVTASAGVRLPDVQVATPRFDLRLAGTLNSVTAELLCTYGDRAPVKAAVNPQDKFVFRDPQNADRLLLRNLAAEESAIARLERAGFARTDAAGFVLHGQANVVRFFAIDFPKVQRDWNVAVTAQVQKWTSEIERVTPRLEIVGSGQDWFEVRYSLTTPGGEDFSNAEIQRLLRSGQSQTRLRNGRLAVIDTAGLEDFEQVIRDCDPDQTQPGLYRIDRAQASYFDATARELGSAIADRREALKKFITTPAKSAVNAKAKLGSLAKILREYQVTGFEWLTRLAASNLGGILADEMGLGKTVQTLAFLRAHKGNGPALIVCPTSLVMNWQNEARKFTPELKSLVLEGTDRAALFGSIAAADIVITSYALLRRDIDELRTVRF
ncbi:MAG: DEAD/DEAH box helicase, partial [Verrucomicrobiota bacterium]|nr:DEAD/DEAH box helicase [Verrucomicrobiota bacterium]